MVSDSDCGLWVVMPCSPVGRNTPSTMGNKGVSLYVSDADYYVVIRNLVDSIFSILSIFTHQWKIQIYSQRIFLPSVCLDKAWHTLIFRADGFNRYFWGAHASINRAEMDRAGMWSGYTGVMVMVVTQNHQRGKDGALKSLNTFLVYLGEY